MGKCVQEHGTAIKSPALIYHTSWSSGQLCSIQIFKLVL